MRLPSHPTSSDHGGDTLDNTNVEDSSKIRAQVIKDIGHPDYIDVGSGANG